MKTLFSTVLLLAILAALPILARAEEPAVRAAMVDATHAVLVSAAPLSLTRPVFTLDQPDVTVKTWTLSRQRDRLLLTLSAPLTAPASLSVTGLAPDAAARTFSLQPAVWPARRDKLVWLWENQHSLLPVNAGTVAGAVPARLRGAGDALFDADGRLQLLAGEATAADGRAALRACRARDQFTVECLYTPTLAPVEAALIRLGERMALRRAGPQVHWEMPSKDGRTAFTCQTVTTADPLHLLISVDRARVTCYVNGQPVLAAPRPAGAAPWAGDALTLGARAGADHAPQGTLEGVALYARAFTAEDAQRAAAAAAARQAQRQPAAAETKQVIVMAELVACTAVPAPESILPYRHALITHEYVVREVVAGAKAGVAPGAHLRVARWGILASKPTAVAEQTVGQRYRLVLESFTDHPDLDRQFTVDELPENFDLPYLLEMTRL